MGRVWDIPIRKHFISVVPKTPLPRLYQDLWRLKQGVFPVTDEGKLVGLLTAEDVSRYLMVQALQKNSKAGASARPPGGQLSSRFTVDLG